MKDLSCFTLERVSVPSWHSETIHMPSLVAVFRVFSIIRNINQTSSLIFFFRDAINKLHMGTFQKKQKLMWNHFFKQMFKIQMRARWTITWVTESNKLSFLIILLMLNHVIFPTEERYFFWPFALFVSLPPLVFEALVIEKVLMILIPQHTCDGLLCSKSSTCTSTVCIFLFMKCSKTLQ